MAIAYDNSLARRILNGDSFSYTSASGAHMFVVTENGVSGITYGGVALTNTVSFEPSIHDGNQQIVKVWELVSPASGANNFSITAGGNPYGFTAVTYTGLASAQANASATGFSNNGTNNTQVASLTVGVTSTRDNCWAVTFVVGGNNAPRTFIAGTGTTLRASTGNLDTNTVGILDGNGVIHPAGSATLVPTWSSGSGFISAVTFAIQPISVPDAPTIGTATQGIGSASVSFTPGYDGGSAITGYTVTASPGGATGTGASSPVTVTGLNAGVPYTFTVHATNAIGDSAESSSTALTLTTGLFL